MKLFFCAIATILSLSANAATWFAIVTDDNLAWGAAVGKGTIQSASKEAADTCKKYAKHACKNVLVAKDQMGIIAVASSPSRLSYGIGLDLEDVKKTALDNCAAETPTNETCEIKWIGVNADKATLAKAEKIAKANTPSNTSSSDCRPRTSQLTCQSRCTNGDCIVTYANGCQMRVRVQAQFNSFSNQWTYPSPSC